MENIDPTVKALAQAIGTAETGTSSPDAYTKKGASGEYGRYQFMPETYKNYAHKYLGDSSAAPTVENQNKIAYSFVKDKKDAGYNPAQIASMWNAGEGKPNAYKENFKGVNSKGVAYDTPAYAKKVSDYYNQFKPKNGQSDVPLIGDAANSYITDASNTVTKAVGGAGDAYTRTTSGEINPLSGLIQGAGSLAGGVGGLLSDTLGHLPVVGGLYKGVEGLIGKGAQALAGTQTGQGLVGGYQKFAEAHPELAGDIEGGFNIATALPILKGFSVAKNAVKGGISTALKGSAEKAAATALETTPKLSEIKAGVKKGLVTEGKNGPVLAPDAAKQLTTKYVAQEMKSGGLPKTASSSRIVTHAEQAANKEAQNLEKLLSESEVQHIVQPEDLKSLFEKTVEKAGASATSGENPAQTLLKVFSEALPKGRDILPLDLLKARKAVGNFIRQNRGDWSTRGVLTGFNSARDAFWNESKDLLVKMAPDVSVLPSLEKQAALYRVSDYLAPKLKKELMNTKKSTFGTRHPLIKGLVKTSLKGAAMGVGLKHADILDAVI